MASPPPLASSTAEKHLIPESLKADSGQTSVVVSGIELAWNPAAGVCSFRGLPVAMMWVDTTLAGLMSGVAAMVGPERFSLALQAEGRKSVESDWVLIAEHASFEEGFAALRRNAAVAGWGDWQLVSHDPVERRSVFRVTDNWEGAYQKALGVVWGSGMLAGKFAGICSKLFGENCWAHQTAFVARGDAFDEFVVSPSPKKVEEEIARLLDTDQATRADMAVALAKLRNTERTLRQEMQEREKTKQALERSRSELRAVYDSAPMMMCLVDEDRQIHDGNRAFVEFTGYTLDELRGHCVGFGLGCSAYTCPEQCGNTAECHACPLAAAVEDAFRTGRPKLDVQYEATLHRGAKPRKANLLLAAAPVSGGGSPAAILCLEDVTERRNAEAHQRRLQEQLQHAMKMEAVGRLAGGVAHDFNNLLTVISGNISLALLDTPPDSPAVELLTAAGDAAYSAASLTNQLLSFTRRQLLEPRLVDVNEVMARLHKMLRRLIGEDIELEMHLDPSAGTVRMDLAQFEQVVVNLAINARDAMPHGGTLKITTGAAHLSEPVILGGVEMPPGAYARLRVADNGMGMTDEVKSHLFEPFFTTKSAGRGTGLGLATLYGAVLQAGGTVHVSSELGQGTVFEVLLPQSARPPEPVRRPSERSAPAGPPRTILLAEDEPGLRAFVSRVLGQAGHRVLVAGDGNAALQIARDPSTTIDLLVTDVVMPGMDGQVLATEFRRLRPSASVLFTSGYTGDPITRRGIAESDADLLPKPFSPQGLLEKVREILGRRGG